jgi:hypothetical protein
MPTAIRAFALDSTCLKKRAVAQAVAYVERPIQLTHLDLDIANKMLFTTYDHWRYEEEVRVWAGLDEKSGDYYFHDFDLELQLKEVIVGGARNPVSERGIRQILGAYQNGVMIMKARLAFNAFQVVEDEAGFAGG